MHYSGTLIRGSGSIPKCHESATLENTRHIIWNKDLRMDVLCVRVELSEAESAAGALLHSPPFSAPSSYTKI